MNFEQITSLVFLLWINLLVLSNKEKIYYNFNKICFEIYKIRKNLLFINYYLN
jgi:hypothetical protein